MKEELCVKDGEIKVLRDNLTRRESELERLKSEKINQIVQQNKQQTDKEKSLQVWYCSKFLALYKSAFVDRP